mmetsp:Transcript_72085/g.165158  ORF Transcript_72085/g.165158 Transcript_72085/m.165158 type:complete len:258 (-) Transcript_72085:3-776(-)
MATMGNASDDGGDVSTARPCVIFLTRVATSGGVRTVAPGRPLFLRFSTRPEVRRVESKFASLTEAASTSHVTVMDPARSLRLAVPVEASRSEEASRCRDALESRRAPVASTSRIRTESTVMDAASATPCRKASCNDSSNSSTVKGSPTENDTNTSSFAACTGVGFGVVVAVSVGRGVDAAARVVCSRGDARGVVVASAGAPELVGLLSSGVVVMELVVPAGVVVVVVVVSVVVVVVEVVVTVSSSTGTTVNDVRCAV